jgi:hypothetical protein
MHVNDYAQGQLYDPSQFESDVWVDVSTLPESAIIRATGAIDNDSWSITRIDAIYDGIASGPNTISPQNTSNPIYDIGGFNGGMEVYGILHGKQDLFVRYNSDDGTFDFLSADENIDIFVQPIGTYATETRTFLGLPLDGSGDPATTIWGAAGSSARFGANVYVGIGYTAGGVGLLGPAIPNALSLVYESEAGYFPGGTLLANPAFDAVEERSFYEPAGASGSGHADAYYSVVGGDPGYWQWWNTNYFTPTRTSGADFLNADLRIHITDTPVTPAGAFDWLVQSSDPVTTAVIPEPLTMISAFFGLTGLGAYIRKRRMTV